MRVHKPFLGNRTCQPFYALLEQLVVAESSIFSRFFLIKNRQPADRHGLGQVFRDLSCDVPEGKKKEASVEARTFKTMIVHQYYSSCSF